MVEAHSFCAVHQNQTAVLVSIKATAQYKSTHQSFFARSGCLRVLRSFIGAVRVVSKAEFGPHIDPETGSAGGGDL